jgi:hypothetical protein
MDQAVKLAATARWITVIVQDAETSRRGTDHGHRNNRIRAHFIVANTEGFAFRLRPERAFCGGRRIGHPRYSSAIDAARAGKQPAVTLQEVRGRPEPVLGLRPVVSFGYEAREGPNRHAAPSWPRASASAREQGNETQPTRCENKKLKTFPEHSEEPLEPFPPQTSDSRFHSYPCSRN